MKIPYQPTHPYLVHLAEVMRAVERLQTAADEKTERGAGEKTVEVDWEDISTVCGWFADLSMTMNRVKDLEVGS